MIFFLDIVVVVDDVFVVAYFMLRNFNEILIVVMTIVVRNQK